MEGRFFKLLDIIFIYELLICILMLSPFSIGTAQSGGNIASQWTLRSVDFYDVAYGHGTFVAVGQNGVILTSPNGIKWTKQDSRSDKLLESITYGEGTFVVVGQNGTIIMFLDGALDRAELWYKKLPLRRRIREGTFVAVGEDDTILASIMSRILWVNREVSSNGRETSQIDQGASPVGRVSG